MHEWSPFQCLKLLAFCICNRQSSIKKGFIMRNLGCILLCMLFCLSPVVVFAGDLEAPAAPTDAGNTLWELTCEASGSKTGIRYGGCDCSGGTLYVDRWCDNGDGTVTDLLNCLAWLKDAGWGGMYPWYTPLYTSDTNANARAAQLADGMGDLSDGSVKGDWRLPTHLELHNLISCTPALRCSSGSCNLFAFTGVLASRYWSSSTNPANEALVWVVDTVTGRDNLHMCNIMGPNYVWPVRSDN